MLFRLIRLLSHKLSTIKGLGSWLCSHIRRLSPAEKAAEPAYMQILAPSPHGYLMGIALPLLPSYSMQSKTGLVGSSDCGYTRFRPRLIGCIFARNWKDMLAYRKKNYFTTFVPILDIADQKFKLSQPPKLVYHL